MVEKGGRCARFSFGGVEAILDGARRLVDLINATGDLGEHQHFAELLIGWGVPVVGPDVTRSGRDWEIDSNDFLPVDENRKRDSGTHPLVVRCGLSQIGGLTPRLIDRIVAVRRQRSFSDAFDFLERAVPHDGELSPLVRSGALDALCDGLTRPQLLWLLSTARRSGHRPLFPGQLPRCLGDYAVASKRRDERQTLGLSLRERPESASAAGADLLQP